MPQRIYAKNKSDITGQPDGATCADYGDGVLRLI